MLVTFESDAHGNITMFGDVAIALINMMGHGGSIPGALSASDVDGALRQLKSALKSESLIDECSDDDVTPVSLDRRAVPLITMLEAALKAKKPVLWHGN